jgi:hypothetical protein
MLGWYGQKETQMHMFKTVSLLLRLKAAVGLLL